MINAVWPFSFCALILALYFKRLSAIYLLFHELAKCSAVLPSKRAMLGSALASNKILAIKVFPLIHAITRGVFPSSLIEFIGTFSFFYNSFTTSLCSL